MPESATNSLREGRESLFSLIEAESIVLLSDRIRSTSRSLFVDQIQS